MTDCRSILDRNATIDSKTDTNNDYILARDIANARHDAARRFDELVAQVRAQPATDGFPHPKAFLQPQPLNALLPEQGQGQIVIINISRWRCDALTVDHQGATVIELPGLTDRAAFDITSAYLNALQQFEQSHRAPADLLILELAVTATLEWLWDHIAGPILNHLGHTTAPQEDWARLWWCPTGPLTLLPLHAAGHHTAGTDATVYDRIISSYTPTLRALANARARRTTAVKQKMLVIALPNTPQQHPLPGAINERNILTGMFETDKCTVLTDDSANRHNMITEVARHQWVHASCHGTQNLADPATAGLIPYDWHTAGLVGLNDLTNPDHTGGEFAFLSACKTATGGITNLDEAINVASAMHYAGWRHVIGTLWSIWDHTAATVTAGIYPHLVNDGLLDPTRSALALHQTVRQLRNAQPNRPTIWAPFMHIGP